METLHNQELVATILEDNVASELTTIQDFLRWTYSTFNRSDIITDKAMTMRGMKLFN